jgi:hypothetical protein
MQDPRPTAGGTGDRRPKRREGAPGAAAVRHGAAAPGPGWGAQPAAGRRPGQPGRPARPAQRPGRARRRLRVPRLWAAAGLVRGPSSAALAARRPHRPGQPGLGLPGPSSGGPRGGLAVGPRPGWAADRHPTPPQIPTPAATPDPPKTPRRSLTRWPRRDRPGERGGPLTARGDQPAHPPPATSAQPAPPRHPAFSTALGLGDPAAYRQPRQPAPPCQVPAWGPNCLGAPCQGRPAVGARQRRPRVRRGRALRLGRT